MKLLIHWPRLGPYHVARLHAAFCALSAAGVVVGSLETASADDTNPWQQVHSATSFVREVALPGQNYDRVSDVSVWPAVASVLNKVRPDAVVIAGWSSVDAWSALRWCRR